MSSPKSTAEHIKLVEITEQSSDIFKKFQEKQGFSSWDELTPITFDKHDVNKPKIFFLCGIVGERVICVYNNQMCQWHLQSKQLQEYIPYLKEITHRRTGATRKLIRVTYKGIDRMNHNSRIFEIQSVLDTTKKVVFWVNIKRDYSYVSVNKDSFTVCRPNCLGGGSVIHVNNVEDCLKIRDLMVTHGFPKECVVDKRIKKSEQIIGNVERLMREGKLTITKFKECYNVEETQQKSTIKIPTDQMKLLEEKGLDVIKIIDEVCQKLGGE